MGLSAAWILAEQGQDVLLLEQKTVGSGASRAAAGMLAPYAEIEFHEDELLAFAEASQERWPDFAAELTRRSGVDVEFNDMGTLLVALDPDSLADLERQVEYQRSRGARIERLSCEACREREPLLSPYISAGASSPLDYQVSNRQTVAALETIVRDLGVEIREQTTVREIRRSHDRVRGVTLADDSEIDAERVVVATGAWTALLKGVGRAPAMIRPVKGQMLALVMNKELQVKHVIRGPGTYLVPKRNGALVVGATVEERGFDAELTAGGVYELLRGAYELIPASYEYTLQETWTGFRPGSRDNLPLLGQTPIDGLFLVAGHYRNGIQQLAGTHAAMSNALSGEKLPEWALPLSCSRFELF